jgi:NAD(P)-dependent dehydrogenase (short-subunit alcohol dehydrogenase family)
MGRLDGKVALITGGARGMGKSHVRHFVAEGARVVFGDVLDDKGAYVAAGLGEQSCRYLHHDVTSEDDWAGADGLSAYTASKFAIRGMTKVAARELAGFGIRVNSVHPGGVLTRMVVDSQAARTAEEAQAFLAAMPLGRFAEAAEISRLVAYLASDDSSYSTGSEFVADGGLLSGPGY